MASTLTTTAVSSAVVAVSLPAVGASLTGVTVIVTVAGPLTAPPSPAVYVNESVPLKFAAGAYVKEPFGSNVSVPWAGPEPGAAASASPLPSRSLPSTPGAAMTRFPSSLTV